MRMLFTLFGKLKGLGKLSPSQLLPERLRPSGTSVRRFLFLAGFVGCTALAFWYGRQGASQADATPPAMSPLAKLSSLTGGTVPTTDYGMRVVAHIYGTVPVTREDLGEYLIARYGVERIEFLVNRKIVEKECAAKGVFVTDAEVQHALKQDIEGFGRLMTEDEFVKSILKRFNKTLYEWKEDVIRPKLALSKLCRPNVKVTEEDLMQAYEIRYGPRVEVRIICLKESDPVMKIYDEVKTGEEKFRQYANSNFLSHLAMNGGKVPPIHKHFPDPEMEKEAFSLKEGGLSKLIQLKDRTHVIMKCDKQLPRDASKEYKDVRLHLELEVFEQKLAQEIPKVFNQLREAAQPKIYLGKGRDTIAALEAAAHREAGISAPPPVLLPGK